MKRVIFPLLCLLLMQCQRERDKHFEEPTWAGRPLYEVLQEKGNFSKYLACVDKTLYAESVRGNGLWTIIAPNDAAMTTFMTARGYSSVDDIPFDTVNRLVAYSMLYNKYPYTRLTDILGGGVWDTIASVKKQTPYYETLHRERYRGDLVWTVYPTNGRSYTFGSNAVDNNYKYLPFYLDRFFSARQLTEEDYNTFYPNVPYTGHNVQAGSLVPSGIDMEASNGVAHEVDAVSMPLPNLEEQLQKDEKYSDFWKLVDLRNSLDEPLFYTFMQYADLSEYFKKVYPSYGIDYVYCRFCTGLDVPINSERYWDPVDVVNAEQNGYTIFAPTNAAVQRFYEDKIAHYGYPSIAALPYTLVGYFLNAHMVGSMIWPMEFRGAKNSAENFINGVGLRGGEDLITWSKGTLEPRVASNGFFYGCDNYVRSPYFETVLSEILLRSNDRYSFLYGALNSGTMGTLWLDLAYCSLNAHYEEDYIVLALSDDQLRSDGFSYAASTGVFSHTAGAEIASSRISRLVRSHIFRRVHNDTIDTRLNLEAGAPSPLDNAYGGYSYLLNDYGDLVRVKGDQLQMVGNMARNEWVTATKVVNPEPFLNGTVYTIDRMLQYSPDTIVASLRRAKAANPNISKAVDYLIFLSDVSVKYPDKITNLYALNSSSFYTLFLPTNAAIDSAEAHDLLYPAAGQGQAKGLPTLQYMINSTSAGTAVMGVLNSYVDKAIEFFKYHVVAGGLYLDDGYNKIVLNDGKYLDNMVVATGRKVGIVNSTFLRLQKYEGRLFVETYRSAAPSNSFVVQGENRSNLFGPKMVIHEINTYFNHVPEEE